VPGSTPRGSLCVASAKFLCPFCVRYSAAARFRSASAAVAIASAQQTSGFFDHLGVRWDYERQGFDLGEAGPYLPDFALDAYQDRDLVFANELGGPIHPDLLTEWFREHRKAAGIRTGSLHLLLHTAPTMALTSGVPVHIVAARLGDTPQSILGTYAHLLPQSDEVAAERVAALLGDG
jgi:hypothetical protein